ncbi:Hypothetical protein R9X50_00376600 [Acrodontium crateriforme]|uniref:SPX domain-containing protein n=1 Tax=Acrodontium crateriforme TaxID=150365 RepID=A0AAQ3M9P3_9PEZI|nr:Hypothetical protein R9X50_00376600 [Acrodontium crateriforme]
MKYGQTLQQRSIPAWSHHNIDYNDIKQVIKEQTTPGRGKTISVPGRGDDKLAQLEDSLFAILAEQHHRIDLFVRSKSGEIKRRLGDSEKQLKELSARIAVPAGQRIPVGRLERYGRLENHVLKAGEEIKSLARFTSIQRTAFRKLLKKYRKWTGSTQLEDRFRTEILDDPKGFTNVDLGPLLDEYSATLHGVRTLYERRIRQNASSTRKSTFTTTSSSSSFAHLQSALKSGSRAEFDTAVATIPLGEDGQLASYFVHPESVIELQMLLLQHCRYFSTRSRANSVASPVSPCPHRRDSHNLSVSADFFSLGADSPERFEREQNTLTVDEREHIPGISPQKVRICARWNNDEDVQISSRTANGNIRNGTIKQKQIDTFFDKTAEFSKPTKFGTANDETTQACRRDLEHQSGVRPLYKISSCRSRFVGPMGNSEGAFFATLDTGISFECLNVHAASGEKSDFPFAVLQVRQEDPKSGTLIATLDASHLVERVRGFSFEAHAIWTTCQLSNQSPPMWLPLLTRDIRKLPPSAPQRPMNHSRGGSGAQSATAGSSSTYNDQEATDATVTFDNPPIRSFRKKRRRAYPERNPEQQSQRYWSEYDHPEDMSDGGNGADDAYVIYIDPNQKSAFEGLIDRIGDFFRRPSPRSQDEEAYMTPASPRDDESSSDEEETTGLISNRTRSRTSYGATTGTHGENMVYLPFQQQESNASPNPIAAISFIASVAILVTAYFLVLTSRRKLRYGVDAGVIFAMVCSLFFALFGFGALFRQPGKVNSLTWTAAGTVLTVDIVGSAGLLAWMLS